MNAKVTLLHGRVIRTTDWTRSKLPFVGEIGIAYTSVLEAVDQFAAKSTELASSKDYTPEGRAKRLRDFLATSMGPVLKGARDTLGKVEGTRWGLEAYARGEGPAVDKTDIAGALRRQEIRTWCRSLPDAKRVAMLAVPEELDPQVAMAITETIPELSGVTREQQALLEHRALIGAHPDLAQQFDEIDDGAAALHDALRMATKTLEGCGIPRDEIAAAMGEKTIKEKIAASLGGGGDEAA